MIVYNKNNLFFKKCEPSKQEQFKNYLPPTFCLFLKFKIKFYLLNNLSSALLYSTN